ncbi:MAG: hypothetical protein HWD92_05860 [Flavobacteriia bacterium]|nr:hypothetical protein [Flavobacteriia bacterium]
MRSILFAGLLLASMSLSAQSNTENALEYMEEMDDHIEQLKGETWSYLKAATRGRSARTMERRREDLIEELGDVRRDVVELGSFHGNRSYQQAVLEYLRISDLVMRQDFARLMDLEEVANQSYDAMEAYLLASEIAGNKLDSAFADYADAKATFATEYNIRLVEGEMSRRERRMVAASNALEYYNDMFLVYFRANVQDIIIIDVMNNGDVLELEQNISALKEAAQMSMAVLDTFPDFNGDRKLSRKANELMEFYIELSEEHYPKVVEFYIAKEDFEELHARIESTRERDLTQEDIDTYNAAVENYNQMIEVYNTTNEQLNDLRSEHYEMWEEAVEDFFDEHS